MATTLSVTDMLPNKFEPKEDNVGYCRSKASTHS